MDGEGGIMGEKKLGFRSQFIKKISSIQNRSKEILSSHRLITLVIVIFMSFFLIQWKISESEILVFSDKELAISTYEDNYFQALFEEENKLMCLLPGNEEKLMTLKNEREELRSRIKNEKAKQTFPITSVRRFPWPYTGPKIVINVAARKLRVYENEELVKTYTIAVGSPRHRTPLGYREMHRIVWNPWWIPPKSNWARHAKKTPPGPKNPLGPVKMKLGSGIMVHGTNQPYSIGRAASHGCMRMYSDQAIELARYLQEKITGITNEAIYKQYKRNRRRSYYINLPVKIPVTIVYEIAEIEDGKLHIYKDIYSRKKDKLADIRSSLILHGYNIEKFNMNFVKKQLRSARNRKDISLVLNELRVPQQIAQTRLSKQ